MVLIHTYTRVHMVFQAARFSKTIALKADTWTGIEKLSQYLKTASISTTVEMLVRERLEIEALVSRNMESASAKMQK